MLEGHRFKCHVGGGGADGGVRGGGGSDGVGGGDAGGAACAQTSHPAFRLILGPPPPCHVKVPIEDHVKALVPSSTLLGPVVWEYATAFTTSLSKEFSVLKAVALRSKPTAGLSGVIVHDSPSPYQEG